MQTPFLSTVKIRSIDVKKAGRGAAPYRLPTHTGGHIPPLWYYSISAGELAKLD